MQEIAFVNVPPFQGVPSVTAATKIDFFRKSSALRSGYQFEPGSTLGEAVAFLIGKGLQCLGQAELHTLAQQAQQNDRRLYWIRKAQPYEMPFLVFPRDDIGNEYYPALASTPKWAIVGVPHTLPLCSNRFLLAVKSPRT